MKNEMKVVLTQDFGLCSGEVWGRCCQASSCSKPSSFTRFPAWPQQNTGPLWSAAVLYNMEMAAAFSPPYLEVSWWEISAYWWHFLAFSFWRGTDVFVSCVYWIFLCWCDRVVCLSLSLTDSRSRRKEHTTHNYVFTIRLYSEILTHQWDKWQNFSQLIKTVSYIQMNFGKICFYGFFWIKLRICWISCRISLTCNFTWVGIFLFGSRQVFTFS